MSFVVLLLHSEHFNYNLTIDRGWAPELFNLQGLSEVFPRSTFILWKLHWNKTI